MSTPHRTEPHDVRGLARLLAATEAALRRAESEGLDDLGLRGWEFRLLDHLAREGARSPSAVATELEVAQPTVSGWIVALRERGLIERVDVEGDGRRALLRLTEEGATLRTRAADAVRRRQLHLLSAIDPVAQAELITTLERLVAASR